MGILDEDVVRVRESADVVAVISNYTQLRKTGRNWVGLCPFHGEKTPSFSVNDQRGVYYCFGCQAKGDVISFVREIEHLDFVGAVEHLAGKSGVTLRYTDRDQGESRKRRARLAEAVAGAVEWYHNRLLTAADAGPARAYLRDRGLDGEAVRAYRVGWAPDGWDLLARDLQLPDAVLADSGLGFMNRRNRQQDFFRARVLFPIFDAQGDPLGFGGRKLPGTDGPKYRNTPETKLYSKGKVLYGLNWAKDEVVRADRVLVCEGYTDVIGFAAAGMPQAVATCGTALTEDHVRLLTRFANRIVLAFDPDAAGQAAAERFYGWERDHDIDVAVADLPGGQDPADLARSDPDRLRVAVDKATPFLGFRVERVLAAADLSSPEGRGRAAEAALAVIAEHPSELVRDQYVMQVADRCRVEPDRLRAGLSRDRRRPIHVAPPAARRSRDEPRETVALRLAVHRPADMLPRLDEILFADDQHRNAFRALRDQGDLHAAIDAADPAAADLLQRLAVEDIDAEPSVEIRPLLAQTAVRELAEIERLDMATYNEIRAWLKVRILQLAPDAQPDRAAEDQLLAWLRQRTEERG